jgi:hypothetical protein
VPAVDAAGVLFVVSGGLTLLGGLLLFTVASLGLLFSALAVVRLAVAVLEVAVGLALQARRLGSRVRGLAVSAAAVVAGLLFLSRGGFAAPGALLPAVAAGLLCRAGSRAEFGAEAGVLAGDLAAVRSVVRTTIRTAAGTARAAVGSHPEPRRPRP